jgi:hypothetical protein
LAHILLAAALSMTVADFVELQKLSAADLRTRFRLPASCEPSLAALTTDAATNQISVAVDCRVAPAEPSLPASPARMPSPAPGKAVGK